mgnify:CR=1 FL=1
MKLTDKINFRQPKYMLPLIVYLPVIGTAYFVFDMFDTKIEDKPAANLQTTEYLNSDLPEAQIKGGDGIGGRYESMVKSYGKIEDHSAISNIDRNNQDEKEEYESKYSDAELELLDKEAAQSASMQDKDNKAVPTSMIKYSDRSYLLQKGSALELLDKEVNALESVQRELVRKITRAKYGLTEAKEE